VLKLAGVIQGSFGDASQEIKITGKNKTSIPFSNRGIAGVIPAYKLYEVLFSEELKKQRGF
jgi:ABC-type sugar transport system ATPase subunit